MAGTWSAAERALAVAGLTSRSSFVEIESSGPDLQRWLLELLTLARGRISDEPGDDEASRTLQEIESAFEVVTTQFASIELAIARVKFAKKRVVSQDNLEALYPVDRTTVGCTPVEGARLRLRRIDKNRWHSVIRPPSPKRPVDSGPAAGAVRKKERKAKEKAAAGLRGIMDRAGEFSALGARILELGEDGPRALEAVLLHGAAQTIAAHVRSWEKMELWWATKLLTEGVSIADKPFYPVTGAMFDQYITSRTSSACGASTPDLIKAAVNWVATKLMMPEVNTNSSVFKALRAMAIDQYGKPVREAKPVHITLIKHLELMLANLEDGPRLLCGIFLCMIYASLRFDDQRHVCPGDLTFSEGALRGTAWQTKVERNRKGTRFAVPDVSLSGRPWLQEWHTWPNTVMDMSADFWLPKMVVQPGGKVIIVQAEPADRNQSLRLLRELLEHGAERANNVEGEGDQVPPRHHSSVTWHSARCTVITWAGAAGRSATEMILQMRSKDPKMAEKYQRDRLTIPIRMVAELCADLSHGTARETRAARRTRTAASLPVVPSSSSGSSSSSSAGSSDERAPDLAFYVKKGAGGTVMPRWRYHVAAVGHSDKIACSSREWGESELLCVGSRPPPGSTVCRVCMAARPDVAVRVGRWKLDQA